MGEVISASRHYNYISEKQRFSRNSLPTEATRMLHMAVKFPLMIVEVF
jgi:hypothetical protein